MAYGAVSSASVPQHDVRWKWLLLLGCAVMLAWTFAMTVDSLGFFARPWYGWWDAQIQLGSEPWSATALHPRRDGATAKAGIVDGDAFDLRRQSLDARAHYPTGRGGCRAAQQGEGAAELSGCAGGSEHTDRDHGKDVQRTDQESTSHRAGHSGTCAGRSSGGVECVEDRSRLP